MYKSLKKTIKKVIPKRFIFQNEPFFRFFHGIFYLGNTHQCGVCQKKLRSFIPLDNGDLLCPFCGSLARNRRLWKILNAENYLKGHVLHFSPSRNIYRKLKKRSDIQYLTSDYEDEFIADVRFNITDIDQKDASFDTIICFHVLEHIPNDIKAMEELYRVAKPNANVLIQTPFKDGAIYENESITSPEDRLKHFGQEDHVRIYSPEGLKTRLTKVGFTVKTLSFSPESDDAYFGYSSPEIVLIATKNAVDTHSNV
ncbi:class I SAM-dependent methyltransferase [uncultured Kordia sp.]|uniref:class I SAM-dependent methyltransferase n=1 Tax=uncultured Kordia sp. TaxID=507699 RepID=UPI00262141B5|nr:class I SAM-dependent methyltransferase [uncultured Kordia sp.]